MGVLGAAQSESVVSVGPPGAHNAISRDLRETFPNKRADLAAQFKKLPAAQRTNWAAEFRRRLREICVSETERDGYWQLQFLPHLSEGSRKPTGLRARQSSGMPSARVSRIIDPTQIDRQIMALIEAQPKKLGPKACARRLTESRAGRSGRLILQGALLGVSRGEVHRRVTQLTRSGVLKREPNGTLVIEARSVEPR